MNNPVEKKKRRGRLILLIAVILTVAAFGARFATLRGEKTVESIASIQEKEGRPVEVAMAGRGDIAVWTSLAGTVEGVVQYSIVSTNTIQVVDVLKREGDRVRAGEVVIRLEKAAANPMLHSYERSRALYEDAKKDARRMKALFDEGAISQQALDKAEMALKIAETDLRNAREGTDLVAPYPGVVTGVFVEKGDMAESGNALAWIARTDSVKVKFLAGSSQAAMLRRGQRAVLKNGGASGGLDGHVSRLDLAADAASHLLAGEAVFPNPRGELVPGVLVSFSVLSGEKKDVVRVPYGCLFNTAAGRAVYVIEQDAEGRKRARTRTIETGLMTIDMVEVLSGVGEGETVARFGQTKLSEGELVKIVGRKEN